MNWNWTEKDFESLKNARGLVEGLAPGLALDLVEGLAPGPEAGPGHEAAPGPVAGPGPRTAGRTGPSPETVLGPEVVPSQLTGRKRRLLALLTKAGLGPDLSLRTGPSLETDLSPSPEAGLRTGPNPGNALNRNLDPVLNPGMIKVKKHMTSQIEKFMNKSQFLTQHGKIITNFSIFILF